MERKRTLAIVAAVLMLSMVILTGIPYFSYDGGSASISGYVWFPYEYTEFETYLTGQIEGYSINDAVGIPIFIQVFGVLGAIFLIWKNSAAFAPFIPLAYGVIGGIGYMSSGFLRLGGAWGLHLALLVALVAVGALGIAWYAAEIREEKKASLVKDKEVLA